MSFFASHTGLRGIRALCRFTCRLGRHLTKGVLLGMRNATEHGILPGLTVCFSHLRQTSLGFSKQGEGRNILKSTSNDGDYHGFRLLLQGYTDKTLENSNPSKDTEAGPDWIYHSALDRRTQQHKDCQSKVGPVKVWGLRFKVWSVTLCGCTTPHHGPTKNPRLDTHAATNICSIALIVHDRSTYKHSAFGMKTN